MGGQGESISPAKQQLQAASGEMRTRTSGGSAALERGKPIHLSNDTLKWKGSTRLFAVGSNQNHMRGGHVQRVLRRRWGEHPGEDEAQERIGRQTPSPVPGVSTDPLEDQTPEGEGFGLTSRGDVEPRGERLPAGENL